MARLIEPGGSNKEIKPSNNTFTLEEMYEAVECDLVEFVYLSDGYIMVIDEEGKNHNKTLNAEATDIAEDVIFPGDYIAGNALLCNPNEIN
jgi:hypothetical protein